MTPHSKQSPKHIFSMTKKEFNNYQNRRRFEKTIERIESKLPEYTCNRENLNWLLLNIENGRYSQNQMQEIALEIYKHAEREKGCI